MGAVFCPNILGKYSEIKQIFRKTEGIGSLRGWCGENPGMRQDSKQRLQKRSPCEAAQFRLVLTSLLLCFIPIAAVEAALPAWFGTWFLECLWEEGDGFCPLRTGSRFALKPVRVCMRGLHEANSPVSPHQCTACRCRLGFIVCVNLKVTRKHRLKQYPWQISALAGFVRGSRDQRVPELGACLCVWM